MAKRIKKTSEQKPNKGQSLNPLAILTEDFQRWQALHERQPVETQQFLEAQAKDLVQLLVSSARQVWFFLPDRVAPRGKSPALVVPFAARQQKIGNWLNRLIRRDPFLLLRERLDELEAGPDEGVALAAGLIRYSTARYLIYHALPNGRKVTYKPVAGEEIPTTPAKSSKSASYADRFFMPEWVALDEEDDLLVPNSKDAEKMLEQMQEYFSLLHLAVRLAPYMLADKEYQRKRVGILGQLINQGRALAWFETRAIIDLIRHRAEKGSLNRGLSISLPYFDDQEFKLKQLEFQIIPSGRIMFLLGFVARACRNEQGKVAQDTRSNSSTRNHLLGELRLIEQAFETETLR